MELRRLLEKIGFDRTAGDHLILVGDLINKGPNSAAVVQLAMDLGADAVRGNNEHRVLLASAAMETKQAPIATTGTQSSNVNSSSNADRSDDQPVRTSMGPMEILAIPNDPPGFEPSDITTAASLSDSQLAWIASLPLILRIGRLDSANGPPWDAGMTLVVHAGLIPWIPLEEQSPWALMNMRSIADPKHDLQVNPLLEESVNTEKPQSRESTFESPEPRAEGELHVENLQSSFKSNQKSRLPLEGREGEAWSYAWNVHQNSLESHSERTVVIYGHDALTGLQVEPELGFERLGDQPNLPLKGPRYAFGLDSGCVYGKELTALVLEVDHQTNKIGHRIESVKSTGAGS
ncbi:Fc.00g074360.m01.CDS01 [Cosmosporella sp. VM-42]